jgi:hypothetical protein
MTGATTAAVRRSAAARKHARRTRFIVFMAGLTARREARFIRYKGIRCHSRWFLPSAVCPSDANGAKYTA